MALHKDGSGRKEHEYSGACRERCCFVLYARTHIMYDNTPYILVCVLCRIMPHIPHILNRDFCSSDQTPPIMARNSPCNILCSSSLVLCIHTLRDGTRCKFIIDGGGAKRDKLPGSLMRHICLN